MSEIVTKTELATLTDEELIALIEERSSLGHDAAREALAVIRGEVSDGDVADD